VAAFLAGATCAAAAAGALLGGAGALVLGGGGGGWRARLVALALALAVAVAVDLLAPAVPGPRRQVNERWLDEFRGWVYGAGFGAQLGLGITTVVSSAATYVALLAAFLLGDPGSGAIVLGVFGLIRGVTPVAAARVRRPDQLRALHVRLEALRDPVARVAVVSLLGMTAVAAAGSLA
jgi:hypothetical protein